ncbi:MAG: methyl-accepting chemotaxis protein [Desulfamplus sp.]|nr:methyl-accepting chemotaxis protein [Desulfamplus sp.]
MRLKIKSKIVLGALAMAIVLLSSSAAIVAVIVAKQTRDGINTNLIKTTNILKEELIAQKDAIMEQCKRLVSSSDMGSDIKFLQDFPDKASSSTNRSTFVGNTERLFQSASTNKFSTIATYDTAGNLKTFVVEQQKGRYFAGFHLIETNGSIFAGGELGGNEKLSDDKFVDNAKQPNIPIKLDLSKLDISSESSQFTLNNNILTIKNIIPLMGNAFNPKTEQVEPTPMGILIVHYNIDGAFSQKIKKMTGMDTNIYVDEKFVDGTFKDHQSYKTKEPFKVSRDLTLQQVYIDQFKLDKESYFHALLPLFDGENLIGVVAAIQSGALISANIKNILVQLGVVNFVCILLIIPFIYLFALRLANPLKEVANRLKDIAEGEGDLTMRLEKKSDDEIGELSQWFNIFIEKLQGIISLIAENSKNLNLSSQDMANLSSQMSENSCDMVGFLNQTTASVERVNENIISVAAAMEESSTNLSMIVAASEEMSVTINEVSRKTENASQVSHDAVQKASGISERIKELGDAANTIGKVTDMINEISAQTNLLALNATIEAARAGEAGKGFTVVAGEIKELAKQTAAATKNIKDQIDGIQRSTGRTAKDIEDILSVINTVNETVISIVSDIGEQSSATQEINENVAHASHGISDVSQNIAQNSASVSEINGSIGNIDALAHNIANRSSDVAQGAKSLFTLSEKLDELVKKFKI